MDGRAIMINVFHNPNRHIRSSGIVVSTPLHLGRFPIMQDTQKFTNYGRPEYKRIDDIEQDVKDGDKVYFHYNCLLPDNHSMLFNHHYLFCKDEIENGQKIMYYYFKIKYDLIFSAVRYVPLNTLTKPFEWSMESGLTEFKYVEPPDTGDLAIHTPSGFGQPLIARKKYVSPDGINAYSKEVIMIGSYVLVEPDMENWKDTLIPVPVLIDGKPMQNPDGSPKMKPESEWIQTKEEPEEKPLQGWVRFIGKPLKGDFNVLSPDDYIDFRPLADTRLFFEDKEYFRMRQRHIFARRIRKAS